MGANTQEMLRAVMLHALMVTDVTLLMLSFGLAAVLTTNRERWTDLASFCNQGDDGVSVCLRDYLLVASLRPQYHPFGGMDDSGYAIH